MIQVSNADIQEVVELITIMQKALEYQGMQKIKIEGNIASVLIHYAEMLATEGDLDGALKYLGNSQDPNILLLKDRLNKALGYIQTETHKPTRSTYGNPAFNQPRNSLTSSQPSVPGNWNTAPMKQQFNSPYNQQSQGAITNQSYGNITN